MQNRALKDVVVVIVNFNGGDLLERSIASLKLQSHPPKSIMVVDNDSQVQPISGDEPWLQGVDLIKLPTNIGFAAANNLAINRIQGADWVALLNPDAVAQRDWLKTLMEAVEENLGVHVFASRMLKAEDLTQLDGAGDVYCKGGSAYRRGYGAPAIDSYAQNDWVFSPCGGAALYRISTFLDLGGFDEDFFCYLEDIDLGCRFQLAGFACLFVADAVVHHIGSAITGEHSQFSVYHGQRNIVWVYLKNMPLFHFFSFLPLHLLFVLNALRYYRSKAMFGLVLKAKAHALMGVPGMLQKRCGIQRRFKRTSKRFVGSLSVDPALAKISKFILRAP